MRAKYVSKAIALLFACFSTFQTNCRHNRRAKYKLCVFFCPGRIPCVILLFTTAAVLTRSLIPWSPVPRVRRAPQSRGPGQRPVLARAVRRQLPARRRLPLGGVGREGLRGGGGVPPLRDGGGGGLRLRLRRALRRRRPQLPEARPLLRPQGEAAILKSSGCCRCRCCFRTNACIFLMKP